MSDQPERKIESGVPIPPRRGGSGAHNSYPWKDMNVGDSFFQKPENGMALTLFAKRLSNAAHGRGRAHNEKYTTRQVKGGVRVWRIK